MDLSRRRRLTDLLARVIIGAQSTLLSINVLADFLRTGRLTGLLLLAGELLVVVLTVMRRPATIINRSFAAGLVTLLSVLGPPMLRTGDAPALAPDLVTTVLSAIGLAIAAVGKASLGRSFGLVPANRGVVVRGPYTLVRHPIYLGYLFTHVAFFAQYPNLWNAVVLLVADTALIVRALMEERVLSEDAEYQGYCQRVSWHLVPGVF
jgi:protein-S-isoprenylcysteine O-methyltransferase Ste14